MQITALVFSAVGVSISLAALVGLWQVTPQRFGVGQTVTWNGAQPELVEFIEAQSRWTALAALGAAASLFGGVLALVASA
jgi:hypothetical protein